MVQYIKEKKAIILSILFVLLIMGGASLSSYAFFTYFQSGTENNNIQSGRINLLFEDGINNISITNQFPISDEDAITMENIEGEVVITDFTVSGYIASTAELKYRVYAIKGSNIPNRNRLPDDHVKLYLTETHDYGNIIISNGYGTIDNNNYGALASDGRGEIDTNADGEILLAQGAISGNESTHNYTLRMWISDEVTISDTDTTKTYCASVSECEGERIVFSTMYYSLKIKVTDYNT